MAITNLITNPSFENDLAGWRPSGAGTLTRVAAGWSWRGAWAARGTRAAMAPNNAAAVVKLLGAGVGAAGKTIGFRLTANVLTNPGGLRLMAQTVNAAGTLGTPYINTTPAPRDPGVFNGTGEWEWRGLYTLPTNPEPDIYLFLSAVNGGDGDVIIDAALASFDLIDRSVSRPGEGLDVPPYGDGDDPEWQWEGLAHQSRSVRKSSKVNWVRNPSGEVDASFATTNDPSSTTTPANRIVPTRITSDLEAPEGAAVLEWQIIANADGYASVICGDSKDLVATAAPVSNQEITVFSGWLRIMTALPSGATVGPSLRSYSSTGESQTLKGYLGDPPVGWKEMLSAALEEFPAAAQVTTVPNVPPRWALGGFLFTGLTPGATYTVRTDKGMFRRDHLGTPAGAAGYYTYFDGDFPNAEWLGTAELSASALAVAPDVPGAPSTPTGVTATATSTSVNVTWQASPEADTAGYFVYRDGVGMAETASTSYFDSTVAPATTYQYTVAAYDNGGATSAQSAVVSVTTPPEAAPSLAAPRLYEEVTPLTAPEAANGKPLWQLCRALAAPKEQAQLLVDGHDEPWGVVMDAETCPEWAMDWLAQFAGVTLTRSASSTIRREELRSDSVQRRGTSSMLIEKAQAHLFGTRTVLLRERDGSPYRLTVLTFTAETPNPALVEASVRAQKPAGLLLTYNTITGQDYQQIADAYVTYSDVAAAYVTYGGVADNAPGT